jgi:hypothetical protein
MTVSPAARVISPKTGLAGLRPPRAIRRMVPIAIVATACMVIVGAPRSGAFFSDSQPSQANLGAGRIFPGTHSTSAFVVKDVSGGSAVDRTSVFAVAGDGRTVTTAAWAGAFSSSRYLEFDLNAPLPGGLAVSGAAFRLRFASASAGGTTCVYLQVRSASTGAVLASYGSAGLPAGCVTGTGLSSLSQSIAAVSTTDLADDLRIRVYGTDSAGASSVIDEATVSGSTPYSSFTLYPVRYTDAASGIPVSVPWELQGP